MHTTRRRGLKVSLEELVVNMKAYLKLCTFIALLTSILLISQCGNIQGTCMYSDLKLAIKHRIL